MYQSNNDFAQLTINQIHVIVIYIIFALNYIIKRHQVHIYTENAIRCMLISQSYRIIIGHT